MHAARSNQLSQVPSRFLSADLLTQGNACVLLMALRWPEQIPMELFTDTREHYDAAQRVVAKYIEGEPAKCRREGAADWGKDLSRAYIETRLGRVLTERGIPAATNAAAAVESQIATERRGGAMMG
jgi:hypothetical protein